MLILNVYFLFVIGLGHLGGFLAHSAPSSTSAVSRAGGPPTITTSVSGSPFSRPGHPHPSGMPPHPSAIPTSSATGFPPPHFFPPHLQHFSGQPGAAESLSMMSSLHAAEAQRAMALHAAQAESQRMAEVQRTLENSRKQQAAAAAAQAANAATPHKQPSAYSPQNSATAASSTRGEKHVIIAN
jgi:hypothetical protein